MSTEKPKLRELPKGSSPDETLKIMREDGGVIIKNFLAPDQISRFNAEIATAMDNLNSGSTHSDKFISSFHGSNTKRLTNLPTLSPTFRNEILDSDEVHAICESVFREECKSYWMNTAQVIEIGPGNVAQPLHRDLENNHPFIAMGEAGPEISLNFLIAFTDFTDENGATRVIPGSNHWPDYNDRGTPEMTVPAEMKAGDVVLVSGKLVHGGGANRTTDFYRRAVAFTFQPGYLTPEGAYPHILKLDLVKSMSPRAQKMVGFRSQYPNGSPGLWQIDYKEIGDYLGL